MRLPPTRSPSGSAMAPPRTATVAIAQTTDGRPLSKLHPRRERCTALQADQHHHGELCLQSVGGAPDVDGATWLGAFASRATGALSPARRTGRGNPPGTTRWSLPISAMRSGPGRRFRRFGDAGGVAGSHDDIIRGFAGNLSKGRPRQRYRLCRHGIGPCRWRQRQRSARGVRKRRGRLVGGSGRRHAARRVGKSTGSLAEPSPFSRRRHRQRYHRGRHRK